VSRTVTVDVTADDIAQGKACKSRECQVALALARATGEVWEVGATTAIRGAVAYLPFEAKRFISAFDIADLGYQPPFSIAPFSFTLELPE
jgi:hypothetical protein